MSTSSDRPGQPAQQPDPAARPSRRVFSPEYKLAIVAEYENAPNGEKGAILRREGLYSSHVIEWTRARDAGVPTARSDKAGGAAPKRAKKTAVQLELEKLRRENKKLKSDLGKTRMAPPPTMASRTACTIRPSRSSGTSGQLAVP
ncbi:hypothetical protein [Saccharopolyspora sp. ASAGF58]|uniref:hypothetical protein n=1 Tax=Saccharopolyspora sp. ASAGF58 TaxID=2719023 RepID=UPI0014401E53|nr:hypothetical protein [Saccharopolyspora sp. ASAGF58]QIZ37969.1 hypothetical protein FDZ84_29635 [Saccharopolyspora sp. ASAGF58]